MTERYYTFLLDAFDRFPREGRWVRPNPLYPLRLSPKPAIRLLSAAARQVDGHGGTAPLALEFGVWKGRTIRALARLLPGWAIHGFDSFQGFPQDGRKDWQLDFALPALPAVPPQVTLVPGFFEDTLPHFAATLPPGQRVGLLHIDCDIYSSTRTVFQHLRPFLGPGTVIVFDELLHYHEFPENEFLAFYEFLEETGMDFEWVARTGRLLPFAAFCAGAIAEPGMRAYRRRGFYQNAAIRLVPDRGRAQRMAGFTGEAQRLARLRPLAR